AHHLQNCAAGAVQCTRAPALVQRSAGISPTPHQAQSVRRHTGQMMHQHNSGTIGPRRLIVNDDDFCSSETVKRSVIGAFTGVVLTSCSLMVTGEAVEHAVSLARAHPGLAVGLHLVTVMGRAVLPPAEIPTLVDAGGNFAANSIVAGLKYYFSPQARDELRRELRAQFETFAATGLRLSHID